MKKRLVAITSLMILVLTWIPAVLVAQTSVATPDAAPVGDEERAAKSFAFYPAESGFGSYFESTIEPGQTTEMVALLANTGSVEQDLIAYSVNAYTALGGGFEAAAYGTPRSGVSTWVAFEEKVFSLKSGEGVEIGFEVTVPIGTESGQYIAAISGEQYESSGVQGTDNFLQKTRFVIPIVINVPGDIEAGFEFRGMSLTSTPDAVLIDIEIQNTGNIRVRPEGTVDIVDEAGKLVLSLPVTMESIYAHEGTVLSLGTSGFIESGVYTIRVEFLDPDTGARASAESDSIQYTSHGDIILPTVLIHSAVILPAPSAGDVQFANLDAVINNGADPISNAQLSLVASLNSEEVERYPISQSLSLPAGDTPINTRYIPATGWTSGEWTFELLLETVEPNGAAVVVARQQIEGSITIP